MPLIDRIQRLLGASQVRVGLALACLYAMLAAPAFSIPGMTAAAIGLPSLLLGCALIALSAIDIRTLRLPDVLTLPLLVAGLGLCLLLGWDDVRWRLFAAAFGYGLLYALGWLYLRLRGQAGLGLGDAKLLAAAGAWLGIEGLPTTLLLASLGALLAALLGTLAGRPITANTRMAFGPFLAAATWLVWLYGPLL